jgi:hypothetical protein
VPAAVGMSPERKLVIAFSCDLTQESNVGPGLVKKLKGKDLVMLGCIAFICLVIGMVLLTPRTITIRNDQRTLDFKAPFFLSTIGDSSCLITCKDKRGQSGEAELLYSFIESPIIFLPSPTNDNVIFCLYDFDVHLVLLKINTTKPYLLPDSKSQTRFIVMKSSWAVDEGDLDDWRQTFGLIKKIPIAKFKQQSVPARDFGVFKQHFDKEDVLEGIKRQITLKENAESGSGPRRLN